MNVTWDAAAFMRQLKACADYGCRKALRVKEFENTMALCRQGWYDNAEGQRVEIGGPKALKAVMYTKEITALPVNPEWAMEVTVENADCLHVAARLKKEGYNVAMLNMASRRNPGGGVMTGSGAQEETLFRRTDLWMSLYQFAPYAGQYGLKRSPDQYPLERNFGGIYSPHIQIFRDDERHGYALMDESVEVATITVAGMNRPDLTPDNKIAAKLIGVIKNKMRTILRIGALHGHDALVLGALGCGAFRNPPQHTARLFHEVLDEPEFQGRFKKVVFAIIEDHNSKHGHNPEGNLKPFEDEFKPQIVEMPASDIAFLEAVLNWTMPGLQLFYRDLNTDLDVSKLYPVGSVMRAGFFLDTTAKAGRPVTNTRFIIASAHCAPFKEVPDVGEHIKRWRMCVLHFDSYFKVMDVYERSGVRQVFLLHIPYQAIGLFENTAAIKFMEGATQLDLVSIARQSLDNKLVMPVCEDTTEPGLLERMSMLPCLDEANRPFSLDFILPPEGEIKSLSDIVRKLADDTHPINYPG